MRIVSKIMIGIICAMREEATPFDASFTEAKREEHFGCVFRTGTIDGHDVVLVTSGIGTTNATIATTLIIERYGAERVIMSGVAGGIGNVPGGGVLIARSCIYHDVDATAFGYAPGQVPGEPERYESQTATRIAEQLGASMGVVVTGNAFVSDATNIRERYNADAIDMESCAVAHTCTHAQVPWIIIRAISDHADTEAKGSFEEHLEAAAKKAAETTMKTLPYLPKKL